MSFLKIEYIKKLLLSIISISITNIFFSKKKKKIVLLITMTKVSHLTWTDMYYVSFLNDKGGNRF